MFEEAIYYSVQFDRICTDLIGHTDILGYLHCSDLNDEDFEEEIYIFVLKVSTFSLSGLQYSL